MKGFQTATTTRESRTNPTGGNRNLSPIVETIQHDGPSPLVSSLQPLRASKTGSREHDVTGGTAANDNESDQKNPEPAADGTTTPGCSRKATKPKRLAGVLLIFFLLAGMAGTARFLPPDNRSAIADRLSGITESFTRRVSGLFAGWRRPTLISPLSVPADAPTTTKVTGELSRKLEALSERLAAIQNRMATFEQNYRSAWKAHESLVAGFHAEATENTDSRMRADIDKLASAITTLEKKSDKRRPQNKAPVVETADHGKPAPWIISLGVLANKQSALKQLERLRQSGIPAEQHTLATKGKTLYQLRIAGFATRREAIEYTKVLADKWRITDTWVTRQ